MEGKRMNDTEIRETLAPMVADRICRACPTLAQTDAVLLAHEIIARLQSVLAAEAIPAPGPVPGETPLPPC
jgi:hypothetical protein